jgi:AbrB family looped-hinge helix DNA binding protein
MVTKMEKTVIEKQGRVLIPKKIRDRLGLRSGEEIAIEVVDDGIKLKLFKSFDRLSSELKGCVKESKIDLLELKKIWMM